MRKPFAYLAACALAGILFHSCTKDSSDPAVTPTNPTSTVPTINSAYQVTGTLDGLGFSYIDQKSNFFAGPEFSAVHNPEPDTSYAVYGGGVHSLSGLGFSLYKGTRKYLASKAKNQADFLAFFATGSYGFATNQLTIESRGDAMELVYRETSGKQWVSTGGSQVGSIVTIDSNKDISEGEEVGAAIKAHVKCKLYPEDGIGTVKQVDLIAILPYTF